MTINRGQIHNLFQEYVVKKDEDSFKALYDATYDIVKRIVFIYIQNVQQADTLADDIFVIIYNTERGLLPKFDEVSWLYGLVKEQCIDYLRQTLESEDEKLDLTNVYLIHDETEYTKKLVDTIEYNGMIYSLKPFSQEIVALEKLGQFDLEDISLLLNRKEKSIKRRILLSDKWFKLGIECACFCALLVLILLINIVTHKKISTEYIIACVGFFIGTLIFLGLYNKNSKKKKSNNK